MAVRKEYRDLTVGDIYRKLTDFTLPGQGVTIILYHNTIRIWEIIYLEISRRKKHAI